MFHLVNKYGNVHKNVESEHKRDELIAAGYRLVAENDAAVAATPHPSPAATPSPQGEGLNTVAPYDGPQQAEEPQQVEDPLQMHTTEGDTQGAATTEDGTEGTTEDSAQAVKDPEPATAPEPEPEPEPEAKAPKAAKTSKSTAGKSSKGVAKSNKTKKNAAEE